MKNYHRRDMMKSKRAGRFEETGVYLKIHRSHATRIRGKTDGL